MAPSSTIDPNLEANLNAAQECRPNGDLCIKPIYNSFKIEPKDDEINDKNFPPSLHAAFQVFVMTGNVESAERMVACVESYLSLVSSEPDGVSQNGAGRAVICWLCGHCALPAASKCKSLVSCASCGNGEQTNFIDVVQPDGSKVPWLQPKVQDGIEKSSSGTSNITQVLTGAGIKNESNSNVDMTGAARKAINDLKIGKPGARGVAKKLKPNSKCPCGSEKKVKKCACGLWAASKTTTR